MKKWLGGLYERFCAHHDMERPFLEWIGAVGCIAFPAFYLLRRTSALPPLYDDLALRAFASVLCLLLALRRWWPQRAKPFYLAYAYLTVFFCLSFFLSFTMLKNQGGTPSVVNMVMGAILIVLLADWRNTVVMLGAGYALSLAVYWTTDPQPAMPPAFVISAAGSLLVVLVGALSHYGQKRAELDRMRRLYAGLAGSIAHEMRNPLMQLRHVLDSLESALAAGTGAPAAADGAGDLARVLRQGQDAVTRGLQGISLTLQQLKPQALEPASFRHLSAAHAVRRAVDEFAYESHAQRSRVRVEEVQDFTLRADETALTMVLFNLLKNALYYLPTHPGLVVGVVVDGGGPCPRIVVQDNGPGIAADRVDTLFAEFSSVGKSEGTGLGLAFCRRAMQAFGGEIGCESVPGVHTRFTLSFPGVPQAQVQAGRDDMLQWARLALAGKQVLVVDDEALMRRSTAAKLAGLGCEVEEAESGAQALERLRHAPYDLVLLDVNMPGMDGFEVARRIRQGPVAGQQGIPILGFTALPASVVRSRARQSGMTDFLNKGCDVLELARAMTRAMGSYNAIAAAGAMPTLAGRAILLADDNAFNRAIVKAQLGQLGADVIEAEHGQQVLRLLDAGLRPAAILMDLEMPGLDGVETTLAVRLQPPPVGTVPVILLTAHEAAERHAAARAAGVDGVLVKPVGAAGLREALQRLLGLPAAAAPTPQLESPPGLLDTRRIDDFERMGMLRDMLPGCLGEIRRFVGQLEQSMAARDSQALRQALHSLVGISGEAGAQALHLAAKASYGALAAGSWPAGADWLAEIQRLADQTEKAMQDRYRLAWGPSVPGALSA